MVSPRIQWQEVQIWGVQDRRSDTKAKRPWIVRWSVDRRSKAKTFPTRAEADRFRSALLIARRLDEPFDSETGQPLSWALSPEELRTDTWARRWIAEQWLEWQPRTRRSAVEALARFLELLANPVASPPPVNLRRHLTASLQPGWEPIDADPYESWLDSAMPALSSLTRERLADVDARLGVGDKGQLLSRETAGRYRKVARACLRRAVDLEIIPHDPWPPSSKGRSQRKALRATKSLDVRRLPDPATMAKAIDAIDSHQPGSKKYRVMTAVAYYAGLRPSEVVMLRPRALTLPERGWGTIDVAEADVDFDEPGEPKMGVRDVPIPPVLVGTLRQWLDDNAFHSPDQLIFRTRNGNRPTPSNWSRAWQRALDSINHPRLRVYDCRHAAATTWLRAGVPLAEVARRLGHSVETLVSTYAGALVDDQRVANERIDAVLGHS